MSDAMLEENISVMHAINDRQVRFAIDVAIRPRDYLLLLTSVAIIMTATELLIQSHVIAATLMKMAGSLQMPGGEVVGVATAGFLAQCVDGALGMGYGVTSSTVLVASGLSPTTASASVHLAQLGTTLASGVAHHRFGNVDWPTVARIGPSGVLGAFAGAVALSSIPPSCAKSVSSSLLFALGLYVFARFFRGVAHSQRSGTPGLRLLLPLGLVGGFVDATGGGGWGPVATSGLLADARLPPAKAIGAVSAAEFLVTVAACLGFAVSLDGHAEQALRLDLVVTLLLGGVVAAPVAPLFISRLHPNLLGVIVGGFICLTNARGLLKAYGAPQTWFLSVHVALLAVYVSAAAVVAKRHSPSCSA